MPNDPNTFAQIAPLLISIVGVIGGVFIYKEKIKNLEEGHKDMKTEVKELRDKVITCETTLKERAPVTKRNSPISLTERGQKLLKESGGEKFVNENFIVLLKQIERESPKTAYDIQELSKEVLKLEAGKDSFNALKEYLFKEGEDIEDLIAVMGIHLRDKVLIKKGWNVADIDKHDPKAPKPNHE